MPFKKGQSGNPKGRPKIGGLFTKLVKAQFEKKVSYKGSSGRSRRVLFKEAFLDVVCRLALKGNEKMITLVAHYESGKPVETHEVEENVRHDISDELYDAITSGEYGKDKKK